MKTLWLQMGKPSGVTFLTNLCLRLRVEWSKAEAWVRRRRITGRWKEMEKGFKWAL